MKIRSLLIPLSLLGGCAPAPPVSPDVTTPEIREHIRYLSSDELAGRRTGEEGNRKAARYIAERFKEYGLEPAGNDGYFQKFPFLQRIREGENSFAVSLGKEISYKRPAQFLPLTISADTTISAPLAFAGYGISVTTDSNRYDDYGKIDVRGKIVVVLRYSPEGPGTRHYLNESSLLNKAHVAHEKGAAGIIFLTARGGTEGDALTSFRLPMSARVSLAAIALTFEEMESLMKSAGRDLREIQSRIDSTRTPDSFDLPGALGRLKTEMIKEYGNSANIAGLLRGSDPALARQTVVIGAHMDHLGMGGEGSLSPDTVAIHHGADDNASGTAGLLEAAQFASAYRSRFKRSILFIAFSGEELGLLGSEFYVKNPLKDLDSTVAMLNMDMIGRMKDSLLVIEGMGTSPQWEQLVRKENIDSLSVRLKPDGFGPSDHASFYARNIPVLFFFTNLHTDYHRPSDTWEKINYPGEQKVIRYVLRLAQDISDEPERPLFTKVVAASSPGGGGDRQGIRVSLGVIPDYAAEVEGLKISGARAGSAAEKAGLRANDTIIKFGGKDVRNIYDFMYLLEKYKPGDQVEILVRRGADNVTLSATLEARK